MNTANQAQLEVLGWIVTGALVAVIAAIVGLIRSGRTVSLPLIQWPSRLRHPEPTARHGQRSSADFERRTGAETTRDRSPDPAGHAHPVSR